VNLARGDHRKLQLRPTPCGSIALDDVRPLPAHYTLSREGGGFHADGPVSATSLVVPEGAYRLIVEARDCAKYDDSLHVQAASTPIRPRVRLYCP
jgi:hypothetical protein